MTDRKYAPHPSMNPLDRRLTITLFTDAKALVKKEVRVSLRRLADIIRKRSAPSKEKLPWLKLAAFGDKCTIPAMCLRNSANMLWIDGIEIDYDGEVVSMREGAELFRKAGVAAELYTSPSNTPAKPRWRVLLPTSGPLSPEEREGLVALAFGVLGGIANGKSFTRSQAYYWGAVEGNPHHAVILVDGVYIDKASLDIVPLGKGGVRWEEPEPEPEPDDDEPQADPDWARIDSALAAIPIDCRADREGYYRPIGMALHHEDRGGEEGYARWDAWAMGDDLGVTPHNYVSPADTRYTWKSFRRSGANPLKIATLYYLAKRHGWSFAAESEPPDGAALSAAQWLARDIPEPDFLVGQLMHTASRVQVAGPTGIGKTLVLLDMACATAEGVDFLHWKGGGKRRRVLYIDGEMSPRLMKRRIADACRRTGATPEGLLILSRDDHPDMPPLNTKPGQKWVNKLADGYDVIFFDNLQALTAGNLRETDVWEAIKPWAQDLSRRSICQVWVNHTGLDETHAYGDSTKQWGLETCILLGRADEKDVASFKLKFTKARERTPENRADFRSITYTLSGDAWVPGERGGYGEKLPPSEACALKILRELCGESNNTTTSAWREACVKSNQLSGSDDPEAHKRAFRRARVELVRRQLITVDDREIVYPFGSYEGDL